MHYVFAHLGHWYGVRVQGTINPDQTFVVYMGEDRYLWAREIEEFLDGRFQRTDFEGPLRG